MIGRMPTGQFVGRPERLGQRRCEARRPCDKRSRRAFGECAPQFVRFRRSHSQIGCAARLWHRQRGRGPEQLFYQGGAVRMRIDGIHRGARRRRRTLLAAILSIGALGIFAISALAVHDDGIFELEGNAVNDAAVAGEDWNLVCPPNTPQGIAPGCLGGTTAPASTFDIDPDGQTIFTGGGSKDDLNVTQWRHTAGSVPDKDELLHGFAAQYANGFLYFGADRFAANGDAQIGFWFFQSTVTPGPGGIFVDENGDPAQHQNGDVLVLSDFTKGGGQPTIRVFEWHSPGGAINGTLDQIGGTTATPATCGLQANDNFCAIVNATQQDT